MGLAAWTWHRAGDSLAIGGAPQGRDRLALFGAASAREGGLVGIGMGGERGQSAGQILPGGRHGESAAAAPAGWPGAVGACHWADHESGGWRGVMACDPRIATSTRRSGATWRSA